MQTHSMTPAKITNPIAVKNPEGRVIVPGVKPPKAPKNDAAAASKTTVAIIGPMIARMTEYNILLKIDWSPTVSAIFFTAKSINTSPTISKTMPMCAGTQNSRARIAPTPPSVFAWDREAMWAGTVSG